MNNFNETKHAPYGRDKGKHIIGSYCGQDITFVE